MFTNRKKKKQQERIRAEAKGRAQKRFNTTVTYRWDGRVRL